MSLQWNAVAFILYFEIFVVLLLLLPWIRPSFWNKILKSRLVRSVEGWGRIYWTAVTVVLILLFLDAIREVRKYANELTMDAGVLHTAGTDNAVHMRLFRAQRNLYVSGFALLLFLVIRRLTALISHGAHLELAAVASMRQAESANRTAKSLMSVDSEKIQSLEALLEEKGKELKLAHQDVETLKKQSAGLQKEYDRVCEQLVDAEAADTKEESGDAKNKKSN